MIGEHGINIELRSQCRYRVTSRSMQYVERATANLQRRPQFNHGSVNELYPPIMAIWQSVKYFPVEHKDAMNLCRIHQGGVQCSVVEGAEVAAKPHQGGTILHGQRTPAAGKSGRNGT